MLKDILGIINRDGFLSRPRLVRELGLPQEVIYEGINQLLRMGYLSEENTGMDCAEFCSGCSFAKNCSKEIVKAYKISGKGEKYLKV